MCVMSVKLALQTVGHGGIICVYILVNALLNVIYVARVSFNAPTYRLI